MKESLKKPSLFHFVTEGIRAIFEWCTSFLYRHKFSDKPKGNGQAVLVVPGLLSSDLNTWPLRKMLEKMDYSVYGWEMGMNLANLDDLTELDTKLKAIHHKHHHKVIIIGWSLGGIYTRKLALENISLVKQIITLGSPFRSLHAPGPAMTTLKLLYRSNEIPIAEEHKGWLIKCQSPLPIKTTSIYSTIDGIVPWNLCLESVEDELHHNIKVKSSHNGMVHNLQVLKAIVGQLH